MPVTYSIDPLKRMVFSSASGVVTDADLLTHQAQLRVDPAFDPSFRHIYDFSAADGFDIQPQTIRDLAAVRFFRPGVPRAIVATADVVFGLARMFELSTERAGDYVRVFRDRSAALAWLDQRAEPPEQ